MKEYDYVELIVEKEKHVKDGVHKGMDVWICDSEKISGAWLVLVWLKRIGELHNATAFYLLVWSIFYNLLLCPQPEVNEIS